MKKTVRFGIIGCGLMGKEFASAAARWLHLNTDTARPEITAVCDKNPSASAWFADNIPTVKHVYTDYRKLLNCGDVDAVYCAVPHNLHRDIYCDTIRAKKHLLGEKPFGIDKEANAAILKTIDENPGVLVRCSSEFPFFPACQELIRWVREGRCGRLIEVKSGFKHSSDMDLQKPINWKRMVEYNGEYGCMGDLGIHAQHVPFRMGWIPKRVYAHLSKLVTERPDGKGGTAPCKTWDNAVLLCEAEDKDGNAFPLTIETMRMSPGSTNEWYIEVYGLDCSVKFTTNDPNAFYYTSIWGKEQAWCRIGVGYKPQFPTITGGIFEFGFTDSILQMWAAFISELEGKEVAFGCFTPEETRLSHALQTAALKSFAEGHAVEVV